MKTIPVGEFKTHFSEIINKVANNGETFGIIYGRKKQPVAMIVPFRDDAEKAEREIGLLDGKVTVRFSDDYKMTTEEFLGLV